jgi:hypothetical protein
MEYRLTNSQFGNLQAEDLYNFHVVARKETIISKFLKWCEAQETNRFLWMVLAFFAQIGATVPMTAMAILFLGGNNLVLWIIMLAVNVPVLVLNLAAMPTKTTLPFLFFSWLAQAGIILYCLGFAALN